MCSQQPKTSCAALQDVAHDLWSTRSGTIVPPSQNGLGKRLGKAHCDLLVSGGTNRAENNPDPNHRSASKNCAFRPLPNQSCDYQGGEPLLPMARWSENRTLCPGCGVPEERLCICSIAPSIETKTRFVVLMHYREQFLTSNTGRLVHLMLPNSEVRIHNDWANPLETTGIALPERRTYLLYPGPEAPVLSQEEFDQDERPVTIVVLDGTWRQASRMSRRIDVVCDLPQRRLPEGKRSEFRLRRDTRRDGVSTLESVSRVLGLFENPEAQQQMEHVFRVRRDRILWRRGLMPAERIIGGLPPKLPKD